MNMQKLLISALTIIFLSACTTRQANDRYHRTKIGAATGAVIGAVIGSRKDSDAALKGAAIGGLAGAAIGAYMDRQAAELEKEIGNSGATVSREGDNIVLNMPENITFDTGKSVIKSNFRPVLGEVASIFKKYDKTSLLVSGHTDSVGSNEMNQILSENRANSVKTFLAGKGVGLRRMQAIGYGETSPVASNSTTRGRAQNRRVKITVAPDK